MPKFFTDQAIELVRRRFFETNVDGTHKCSFQQLARVASDYTGHPIEPRDILILAREQGWTEQFYTQAQDRVLESLKSDKSIDFDVLKKVVSAAKARNFFKNEMTRQLVVNAILEKLRTEAVDISMKELATLLKVLGEQNEKLGSPEEASGAVNVSVTIGTEDTYAKTTTEEISKIVAEESGK